jgi:uncharacterized protein YwgA
MPRKATTTKDLLLLLLHAKGARGMVAEPIVGRTRLMKMIFLFDKELRHDFRMGTAVEDAAIPSFEPYDFGPYSSQVYSDLEFLVDLGFVRVSAVGDVLPAEEAAEYDYWRATAADAAEDEAELEQFTLTSTGCRFVERGRAGELTDPQWALLNEFKARCTGTSLRSLLKYVYAKYPETTTRSKIRDQIIPAEAR